jgi:hypothetical protein
MTKLQQMIIQVLKQEGRPRNPNQMVDLLPKYNAITIREACDNLVAMNILTKTENKVWGFNYYLK